VGEDEAFAVDEYAVADAGGIQQIFDVLFDFEGTGWVLLRFLQGGYFCFF
jgi:hypothetical protein